MRRLKRRTGRYGAGRQHSRVHGRAGHGAPGLVGYVAETHVAQIGERVRGKTGRAEDVSGGVGMGGVEGTRGKGRGG